MATEETISGLTTADDSGGDAGAEPAPAPVSDYHAPQVDDRYVPAGEPVKLESPEAGKRKRRDEAIKQTIAEETTRATKALEEQLGELRNQYKGVLEALQRQPQAYAPPPQQPAAAAPAMPQAPTNDHIRKLQREARELLASNNYDAWEEKSQEVILARAQAMVAEQLKVLQPAQAPAAPDPVLLYHAMQQPASKTHGPHVVLNIAQQQAMMLASAGVPPGPARDARAFEMANEFLSRGLSGVPAAAPAPAQSNAGHVLATPASPRGATASSAADARDSAGKIVPTPKERSTAAFLVKKGAFKSEGEYFAELARMHPERVVR